MVVSCPTCYLLIELTNKSETEKRPIKITRKKPELLYALPRLIARLPPKYPRQEELDFAQKLYQIEAGYSGEQKVDRYLELLELPKSSIILTDVHLALFPGHTFQIDTLILTEQYVFHLEIKNITGELYFQTNPHQLRRVLPNGEETIMECPLTQLEVARVNLQSWLSKRGVNVEVQSQIILPSKNATVKLVPPNSPILYLKRLSIFLREMERGPTMYNVTQLKKMSELIQREQTDYSPYPLCKYYRLDANLLKRGQLCSICNSTMSLKNHKQRFCKKCNLVEPNNYLRSIQDWFMLISGSITNKQCRNFLQLKNKDDAYYALNSLRLNKEGKSVATTYYWPKGIPFEPKKPPR
ncbi:nuclease-related domain-containing protein [Sporosarcina sp. G11-34]|uniref:nuclease-related domain-containing protein n=1 Tax=Sporosarcina sp. G11-34 TaxID=2849605 RepID=UPI002E78F4BE|nr:nuclease-related domain-containing protein [Sporosarcina sp. G11-34]MCZ2258645.1 NERD domain-containing protein [Sporosarcina sp. G11-34]